MRCFAVSREDMDNSRWIARRVAAVRVRLCSLQVWKDDLRKVPLRGGVVAGGDGLHHLPGWGYERELRYAGPPGLQVRATNAN